jgi:phosphosulfolactate phosphohydrolase-like enzyme
MRESRTVAIDAVSESPVRHPGCDAIVLIDVICDTTMLTTGVAQHRKVYPAASGPAALFMAQSLDEPLLAADERETWRPGFEITDSPAQLAARSDQRPLVLYCGTGTTVAANHLFWPDVYVACLRNISATVRHISLRHRNVLILDATNDGDVRCEDKMAAGRLAAALADVGFEPAGLGTRETIARWAGADIALAAWGRSAEDLRRRRREADLEFVLSHVDDLDLVCGFQDGQISPVLAEEPGRQLSEIA